MLRGYATLELDEFRIGGLEIIVYGRATVKYKAHATDFFDYDLYTLRIYRGNDLVGIGERDPMFKIVSDEIVSERCVDDVYEAIRKDIENQKDNWAADAYDRARDAKLEAGL